MTEVDAEKKGESVFLSDKPTRKPVPKLFTRKRGSCALYGRSSDFSSKS